MRIELSTSPRLLSNEGATRSLDALDAALLAVIALEGPVGRERVQALLWPDCSRKTAQGNLRQCLFRLRRKTGQALAIGKERLSLAPGVEHDLNGAATILGDLRLDGHLELNAWLEGARAQSHRDGSNRLAATASRLEAEGRLAEAIELAEQLALREPALEHAHRRLMRLHYRRGDRAAALQAYQRCRASLDHAVGAAPSAETAALAALIQQSGSLPEPSPEPPAITLLRPPRLIGRDAAWHAWERAWQKHQIVVISGEPGIGKSRLLDDFTAAHGAVSPLRAHPGDARMPYAAWSRWLRDWRGRFGAVGEGWIEAELARLVPGLSVEGAHGSFAPLRFRQACFDAFSGWFDRGLGHIVVDDLQYSDEASLEVLLAACSSAPRQRLALAVRSTEMPAAFVDWLDDQRGRDTVFELTLGALTDDEIVEWIASLSLPGIEGPTWGPRLARSSGGNPFFMIELLRASQASSSFAMPAEDAFLRAPVQVARLLAKRLEQLQPEALRLAQIAGLAGADFSAELAADTLGVRPLDLTEAWTALEGAQIFRHGVFAHDLMLESAAASVPAALAKTLHSSIAAALDEKRVAPARIAHHALKAGDWMLAARELERAGADAFNAVRHREAMQFYDRAVECHQRLGDLRSAFRAATAAIHSACHVENESAQDTRTLALLEDAVGDSERLAADLARATHLGMTLHTAELIPLAERALNSAQRLHDKKSELIAVGLLTVALCTLGRPEEAIALSRPVAERFDSIPESIARYEFAMAFSNTLFYAGHSLDAVRWCERAIECGERLGRGDDLAVEWGNLALIRLQAGSIQPAMAAGRRALDLHMRSGEQRSVTLLYAQLALGMCLKRAEDWLEAEALIGQALKAARQDCTSLVPVIENHFAIFYLELGQFARARNLLATPPNKTGTLLRRAAIQARLDAMAGGVDFPSLVALMKKHRYDENNLRFDQLSHRLGMALIGPFDEALPMGRALWTEAQELGAVAIALSAAARLASASHEAGAYDDALHWARVALADGLSVAAFDMDAPEFCWHVYRGLCHREPDEALTMVRHEIARVRESLSRIPESYRESYWNRSPYVPRLRAIVARNL